MIFLFSLLYIKILYKGFTLYNLLAFFKIILEMKLFRWVKCINQYYIFSLFFSDRKGVGVKYCKILPLQIGFIGFIFLFLSL